MAKPRKKKGPAPRVKREKSRKWTKMQIGILIFSILIILSMVFGLIVSVLT